MYVDFPGTAAPSLVCPKTLTYMADMSFQGHVSQQSIWPIWSHYRVLRRSTSKPKFEKRRPFLHLILSSAEGQPRSLAIVSTPSLDSPVSCQPRSHREVAKRTTPTTPEAPLPVIPARHTNLAAKVLPSASHRDIPTLYLRSQPPANTMHIAFGKLAKLQLLFPLLVLR